jgi:hypothetical protein
VTSLKAGTRAQALRFARTCYDHLAGQLGVVVTAALLEHGALATVDGVPTTGRREQDRISAPMSAHPYLLGPKAEQVFGDLSVDLGAVRRRRRPLLKFCLDWSEQRHHLAGALGAELAAALERQGWLEPRVPGNRALRVTGAGRTQLHQRLGISLGTSK